MIAPPTPTNLTSQALVSRTGSTPFHVLVEPGMPAERGNDLTTGCIVEGVPCNFADDLVTQGIPPESRRGKQQNGREDWEDFFHWLRSR